jgi:hypothetical protein
MRAAPVKYSAGPLPDGCEPFRVICIVPFLPCVVAVGDGVCAAAVPAAADAARPPVAASMRLRVIMTVSSEVGLHAFRAAACGAWLLARSPGP